MVLSDTQLVNALVEGRVVCCPLKLENVRNSSIDLTLGEYFWRCDADRRGVFNPRSQSDIDRYFRVDRGPLQAKPYASVYEKIGIGQDGWPKPGGRDQWVPRIDGHPEGWEKTPHPFENIPEDWPVIVLGPGERILAHTHEFVGARGESGTTEMRARSSTGRFGVQVCACAGWGDNGYFSRWTWEVLNLNREAIILCVGERLGQIVVHETGPVKESYVGRSTHKSSYQGHEDLQELVDAWTPQDMLPKPFRDVLEVKRVDVAAYNRQLGAIKAKETKRIERERQAWLDRLHKIGSDSVPS